MTKQKILDYFDDINQAYNNCTKHDSLSNMIDDLINDIKADIEERYDIVKVDNMHYAGGLEESLDIIDKHIKEQE